MLGDDVTKALEDETPFDMTLHRLTLSVSNNADTMIKAQEDKEFKVLYVAQIKKFIDQQDMYDQNLIKAYAFIYSHYTKDM